MTGDIYEGVPDHDPCPDCLKQDDCTCEEYSERQVEIVVRDGAPAHVVEVVDISTGRRIGALKRLSIVIDAEIGAQAEMTYFKLEGSPDGTVPPDRAEPVVTCVDENGNTETIMETVQVIQFVSASAFRARPYPKVRQQLDIALPDPSTE